MNPSAVAKVRVRISEVRLSQEKFTSSGSACSASALDGVTFAFFFLFPLFLSLFVGVGTGEGGSCSTGMGRYILASPEAILVSKECR